ncbi:MAG: nucleotidyltransferase family protein [Erythrobacter sp.]|uniref:nucleotidyltransferase domain-containing protein n=1 Tax=Erythrobacter sp. TaxID=1042 RepID=UPI0026379148|nr:nucleotidyltransferase family protein [Erythrobacter sp.]MDJ0979219.1 nucleotidyltransferase family protein [Erythrobacter sp.]
MMSPDETPLARKTLLALCAGGPDAVEPDDLRALAASGWDWIAARSQQYRLLPLLHAAFAQRPGWPVPEPLREACCAAHRRWVFRSLVMQQALIEVGAALDEHRIPYAALKGASLSLQFYAEPALRPMRDLDIMVAPDDAERAYALLKQTGYAKVPGKGEHGLERKHHLPLIVNANRVYLELHHRIAPCDWSGSQALGERLVANARAVDFQGHTVRMPDPSDTYLHLVVHAAFHNLFDNGPNLLSDLQALEDSGLVERAPIEAFAREHGLEASLALIEALMARARARLGGPAPKVPAVPEALLDQAAALMTQDPDQHWQRLLLRKRRSLLHRAAAGVRRAFRPSDYDLSLVAGEDVSGLSAMRHYPAWLMHKTRAYLAAEFQPELDREAAGDAQLEKWIGRPALTQRDVQT